MQNSLKEVRMTKGITQVAMARKLNITSRMYQYLESGHCEPRISQVYKMSQILDTPVEILFPPLIDYSKEAR
ncbi:hypothetical protein FACS1894187_05240 [Synergistales bacterium]|nr:hypothetical protein FACS1894187_05240 [Synergistales bacterium]